MTRDSLLGGRSLGGEDWLWRSARAVGPPHRATSGSSSSRPPCGLETQRTIAAVSALVAVIAIALSIFALIERSDAINNQKIAQSRLLAAEAEGSVASDASLSTLLALKALKIHYTIQAAQALRDSL